MIKTWESSDLVVGISHLKRVNIDAVIPFGIFNKRSIINNFEGDT